jgi:hypothetical protein
MWPSRLVAIPGPQPLATLHLPGLASLETLSDFVSAVWLGRGLDPFLGTAGPIPR